jgi:alkaline phosphatase D
MNYFLTVLFSAYFLTAFPQVQTKGLLKSGPMLTQVELRTARIWIETAPSVSEAAIEYWEKLDSLQQKIRKNFPISSQHTDFRPLQIELGGLKINTTYQYNILIGNHIAATGYFTTKQLWQWRQSPPDFSFLAGSCAYTNEPIYDRPGKPYGNDTSIFSAMSNEKNAAFMLWLGDNWYTREADYYSEWGLWYRASHDRSVSELQNFLKAMPHYAIWDDHDYGPNDADKSYILKEASRTVFMNYWGNPSYGQNNQGIYSKFTYSDCDFFLMDDRWFRSADAMQKEINGLPNTDKRMWGDQQMEWLKNALLNSKATFKFIVTGSQTLNVASSYDCLQSYPVEFTELMNFLTTEKVNGVLFLTGDRHHSEVIKYERSTTYPLYDITSSPLTSGVGKVSGKELNNPAREANTLVEAQNYARLSVTGPPKNRTLKIEFVGIKGEVVATWSIQENKLRTPSQKKD